MDTLKALSSGMKEPSARSCIVKLDWSAAQKGTMFSYPRWTIKKWAKVDENVLILGVWHFGRIVAQTLKYITYLLDNNISFSLFYLLDTFN